MTAARRIRTLVVDDSAFARKVVREVLAAHPEIEVVGTARDGLDALEQVRALAPDVVTLDLMMPAMDGIEFLFALPAVGVAPPRVVVVTSSDEDSEVVVEALALGAFDFVRKPTSLATDRLYEIGEPLVRKVRAAGAASVAAGPAVPAPAPRVPAPAPVAGPIDLVVIGTSTGGPHALTRLLPALPSGLAVPVAVALHIPAEYTVAMATRLHDASALRVVEAGEDAVLEAGKVTLARGGSDLCVGRAGGRLEASLGRDPARLYHPSVDVLFESAARTCGERVLAVVLTGMGDDGLLGARAIRAAGGQILVQDEASSVVYGMPRVVLEAGLADAQVALDAIPAEIVRRVRG